MEAKCPFLPHLQQNGMLSYPMGGPYLHVFHTDFWVEWVFKNLKVCVPLASQSRDIQSVLG